MHRRSSPLRNCKINISISFINPAGLSFHYAINTVHHRSPKYLEKCSKPVILSVQPRSQGLSSSRSRGRSCFRSTPNLTLLVRGLHGLDHRVCRRPKADQRARGPRPFCTKLHILNSNSINCKSVHTELFYIFQPKNINQLIDAKKCFSTHRFLVLKELIQPTNQP